MAKKEKKNNKLIMARYGVVVVVMLLFSVMILFSAAKIIFTPEGKKWKEVGEQKNVIKDRVILPKRGNIYTYDGKLLATSEPLYGIYMDFWAEGMAKDTLIKYVGELSKSLSKSFPSRTSAQYKNVILKGWSQREKEEAQINENEFQGNKEKVKKRSRYVRIIKEDISYLELKKIRTFPFLNQRSNRSGLIAEERNSRNRPFGNLASRTVGTVYKDLEKGGASGIEMKFDSILVGEPGVKNRQKIEGKWMDIVVKPSVDGYDIITTLDADIQDITERSLRSMLEDTEAESGTAIIMEVETGEIKGIANLDRMSNGKYAEGNPNAFSYMNEPGSTFKTVTAMVALDDEVVTPTDSFHVGTGMFQYNGRWVLDHYWRKGQDRGSLTLKEGIEVSSNIVMSKIVLQGYKDNPKKYVEGIDRIGLRKPLKWDVPLSGIEGTSVIRYPNDKNNYWSKTTLPWMSFGYESKVPPIYMLMFYNGIANNGKMIKPFIAKQFLKNGMVEKEMTAEVVNPKMCKDTTLTLIKDMLESVIINGTAKVVASDYFPIAGKTGTAMIASGGGYSGYFVSFCGYFPADKPKYTCFVGIRKPKGIPSGGGMAGMVFKNIAERTYILNEQLSPEKCVVDSVLTKMPVIKNGVWEQNQTVLNTLGFDYSEINEDTKWVKMNHSNNTKYIADNVKVDKKVVPNVVGMGARDALFLLEKLGLRVNLIGSGKVVSQSFNPGQKLVKGTTISITLQ